MSQIEKLIILNGYQANYEFEIGNKYQGSIIREITEVNGTYRFVINLYDGRIVKIDASNVVVITK